MGESFRILPYQKGGSMNFIRKRKNLRLAIILASIILILIILFAVNAGTPPANPQIKDIKPVVVSGSYAEFLSNYKGGLDNEGEEYRIPADAFELEQDEEATLEYYEWINPTAIKLKVNILTGGLFLIYFRYQSLNVSPDAITLAVEIDGQVPYSEASQMILDTLWQEANKEVGTDRYGNDVSILQTLYEKWQTAPLKDAGNLYPEGLQFYFDEGENEIEISKISGELRVSEIIIKPAPKLPAYEEYLKQYEQKEISFYQRIEAEQTEYKNSSSINRGVSRDVGVLPFSKAKLKLNVMGVDSYQYPGEAITWKADVPEAGYYYLSFKVKLTRQNTTSYRTLYINGEVPFREAKHLAFSYGGGWENVPVQSFDKKPYLIYLEPGDEITLAVDSTLFVNVYRKLKNLISEMSELGLDVTKLTRNNVDKNIDWEMEEYFPDLRERLARWQDELEEVIQVLRALYGAKYDAEIIQEIKAAKAKIKTISEDINELPRRLGLLSKGTSSAVQLLSSQIDPILQQPIIIDSFFIHTGDKELPKPEASFLKKLWISVARFFLSFFDQVYSEKAEADELEVWVNRSRQYVDVIQRITDDVFTSSTGIKVKISLMSDDSKLLLANSAGKQPDVALGVSAWIPNEYGMRGMLYDLTQEADFTTAIRNYHPEQLIPMIYDNGLYGLPETENFYVLFYRKDILSKLDLKVPDTWEDVINILPVLERYGMSFYIPLSSSTSFKSWDMTSPFIFQFEGEIYSPDGFKAAVDDENTISALNFIADLYREYSMPYQVTSFFNDFRSGTIPLGIADFGTYLQLLNTAAEIKGLWDIALVPGLEIVKTDPNTGEEIKYVNRYMSGAQQAGIIFNKSQKKEQAWTFLKWWLSTDTQTLFANNLVNTLGSRYLWNTANLEAFSKLTWNENHKQIILKQWEHVKEVPKIPGSYMVEREISNTLNKVIFDNANLRSTISDSLLVMNKEIDRKMKEFGYLDSEGNRIREYYLPDAETVRKWLNG